MARIRFLLLVLIIFSGVGGGAREFSRLTGQAIIDGEEKKITIYNLGGSFYLDIRQAAEIYKASISWRSIARKVIFSLNNQELVFYLDRRRVDFAHHRQPLDTYYLDGRLYLPVNFFTSEDFSHLSGWESTYNPETKILDVNRIVNVLAPRIYSQKGYSRIVVELAENLSYSKKSTPAYYQVDFLRGKCRQQAWEVRDGLIKEVSLKNRGRTARLTVYLSENVREVRESYENRQFILTLYSAEEMITAPSTFTIVTSTLAVAPSATPVKKTEPEKKKIRLVIDAGHGGDDPGAIGPNGSREKDINLNIALETARLLKEDGNFEVILTRDSDVFIPLAERTNLANEKKAELFISIHCNAAFKKSTRGFEIYFLSEKASDPEAAATEILENSVVELEKKKLVKKSKVQEILWALVVNEFINESSELCSFMTGEIPPRLQTENRGVRQAGFYVLRGAQMPAVLVECGYLSNPGEEAKLRQKYYQQQISDGIYNAILKYCWRKKLL